MGVSLCWGDSLPPLRRYLLLLRYWARREVAEGPDMLLLVSKHSGQAAGLLPDSEMHKGREGILWLTVAGRVVLHPLCHRCCRASTMCTVALG